MSKRCFADLENAYDPVSKDKLRAILLEYDVRGWLLSAIKLLHKHSEVYVCVNGLKTKPIGL